MHNYNVIQLQCTQLHNVHNYTTYTITCTMYTITQLHVQCTQLHNYMYNVHNYTMYTITQCTQCMCIQLYVSLIMYSMHGMCSVIIFIELVTNQSALKLMGVVPMSCRVPGFVRALTPLPITLNWEFVETRRHLWAYMQYIIYYVK